MLKLNHLGGFGVSQAATAAATSSVAFALTTDTGYGSTSLLRLVVPANAFTGLSAITGLEVDAVAASNQGLTIAGVCVGQLKAATSYGFAAAPVALSFSGSASATIGVGQTASSDRATVALSPASAIVISAAFTGGQTKLTNTAACACWGGSAGDLTTLEPSLPTFFGATHAALISAIRAYGAP